MSYVAMTVEANYFQLLRLNVPTKFVFALARKVGLDAVVFGPMTGGLLGSVI